MLRNLQRDKRPVEDYVSDFRLWSADTKWNNSALSFQFHLGLSESIKAELARMGTPASLNDLFHLCIQIDGHLRERQYERSGNLRHIPAKSGVPLTVSTAAMPRDVSFRHQGISTIQFSETSSVWIRMFMTCGNLCFYCGDAGHLLQTCPGRCIRRPSPPPHTVAALDSGRAHTILPVAFQLTEKTLSIPTVVDSGACSCIVFVFSFAAQHELPLCAKKKSFSVHVADGSVIKTGPVTLETV